MIDASKYKWHIEVIGSLEEFEEELAAWKELAPWYTDEEIEYQLQYEEREKLSPLLWLRPWM